MLPLASCPSRLVSFCRCTARKLRLLMGSIEYLCPSGFGSVLRVRKNRNSYDRTGPVAVFRGAANEGLAVLGRWISETGSREIMALAPTGLLGAIRASFSFLSLSLSLSADCAVGAPLGSVLGKLRLLHFCKLHSLLRRSRADLARKQEKSHDNQKFGGRFCAREIHVPTRPARKTCP